MAKKTLVPAARPGIKREVIEAMLKKAGVTEGVALVGIRGYYLDTMGVKGKNDRKIFDDAIILCSRDSFVTFNGNVDPNGVRKGSGRGKNKGMASLKKGLWRVHRLGKHKGKYPALVQTGGPVTVIRDGSPDYEDTGMFGINIHKSTMTSVSSVGCQTVFLPQWNAFIALVQSEMKKHDQRVMPYLLIDQADILGV